VVSSGELDAEVTAIGTDTFFGKTMALLGAPEERGHLQTVGYIINITKHNIHAVVPGWQLSVCFKIVLGCQLHSAEGAGRSGVRGGGGLCMPDTLQSLTCHPGEQPALNPKAPSECAGRRLLPPPVAAQVLGRVSAALGLLGAAGCLAILGVIIARYGDVGYAFVVRRRYWPRLVKSLHACIWLAWRACRWPARPPACLPACQCATASWQPRSRIWRACGACPIHISVSPGPLLPPSLSCRPCLLQISFVILVSVMPIGLPVVTGAVLAVGAREMVKEKAIVSR
jgi:hypothetical protein